MKQQMNRVLLHVSFLFLFITCETVNEQHIIGTYVGNYGDYDTIRLYKNSIYERVVCDKEKNIIFQNNGSWNFKNNSVIFQDFLINENDLESKYKYDSDDLIIANFPIKKSNGSIKLYTNFDLDYFYTKCP